MAHLQLALNHCLTTGAASAATAAADTNLRLWPGPRLRNRQKRRRAYQSLTHSFTTSLANNAHCQTKMISGRAECCLRSQSVYLWLWITDTNIFSCGVYMGEHMLHLWLTLLRCPKGISSLLLSRLAQVAPLPKLELLHFLSGMLQNQSWTWDQGSAIQWYSWDPLVSHRGWCIVSSE